MYTFLRVTRILVSRARELACAGACVWAVACDSADPATPGDVDAASETDGASEGSADADTDAGEDAGALGDAQADAADPVPCEVMAPTECPSPAPIYADVEPVIAARCLSCHDGRGDQWPLTSYSHVADWYDQVRAMVLACTMPPPGSGVEMPTSERKLVLEWLRCGYPEK